MRLAKLDQPLSPEPILAAFSNYRGSVIDLDFGRVHGPASLARDHAGFASALRRAGVEPGDRVVLAVGNGSNFVCLLTAALAAGAAPLLLHAKTPPAELRRAALRYGARQIVTDSWTAHELAAGNLPATPLAESSSTPVLQIAVDASDRQFDASYPRIPAVPLHPTSGTTGLPKIALRPGPAAVAEADHYIDTIGITSADVIVAATPMSHAYAYGMGVMVPLLTGAKIITTRSFEAAAIRRALVENNVTILPAVPAMLDLLIFGAGDRLRNTARCFLSAGAPLPEKTARRFYDCAGMHVRPLLGTTETGGISVGPDDGQMADGGYVGPPMRGVEAEIRDVGALGAEDVGRLHIRSSSMMAGYLSAAGIDTTQLDDGWFQTGDLGYLRPRGLCLKGRQSEVINVGGLKVIPCEVEEVLATLPGVSEVKVYAGHDRSGRQFVKAAIVGTVDLRAVEDFCERELVYYKRPRTVLLLDKLPRTPSGKVIMAELP